MTSMSHNDTIDRISDIIACVPCPTAPAGDYAWTVWYDACLTAVNAAGLDANVEWNDAVGELCAATMDATIAGR